MEYIGYWLTATVLLTGTVGIPVLTMLDRR